jgi:hypothetical protein
VSGGESGDRRKRRASIVVSYGGVEYERDLVRCRRVLLEREIEGDFNTASELAAILSMPRSNVTGFFAGNKKLSKVNVMRILAKLRLEFDDVHRRVARSPGDNTQTGS